MGQQINGGHQAQDSLLARMSRLERDIALIAGLIRIAGNIPMSDGEAAPRDRARPGIERRTVLASPVAVSSFAGEQGLGRAKAARCILAERRRRERAFGSELFADPAWDMILDLYAAHYEGVPVSISSLCIAAAVPSTTALRWIKSMTERGILSRIADEKDGRRIYIRLEDRIVATMDEFLRAGEYSTSGGRPI